MDRSPNFPRDNSLAAGFSLEKSLKTVFYLEESKENYVYEQTLSMLELLEFENLVVELVLLFSST